VKGGPYKVLLKGVCCLSFSPSGNKIAAAAIDDSH